MSHTRVNHNNQRNTINKARTSNQVIRSSSIRSTQSKKIPSKMSLLWFLELSTNVTWFSTVEVSQNISLTISNIVS